MKRMLAIAVMLTAAPAAAQTITCRTVGNIISCNDGTLINRNGGLTTIFKPPPQEDMREGFKRLERSFFKTQDRICGLNCD